MHTHTYTLTRTRTRTQAHTHTQLTQIERDKQSPQDTLKMLEGFKEKRECKKIAKANGKVNMMTTTTTRSQDQHAKRISRQGKRRRRGAGGLAS